MSTKHSYHAIAMWYVGWHQSIKGTKSCHTMVVWYGMVPYQSIIVCTRSAFLDPTRVRDQKQWVADMLVSLFDILTVNVKRDEVAKGRLPRCPQAVSHVNHETNLITPILTVRLCLLHCLSPDRTIPYYLSKIRFT